MPHKLEGEIKSSHRWAVFLCAPQNTTVPSGIVTVVPKSAFIFLSGKRDRKKERGEWGKGEPAPPDASQLYRANEHKCHCQAGKRKKCITAAN